MPATLVHRQQQTIFSLDTYRVEGGAAQTPGGDGTGQHREANDESVVRVARRGRSSRTVEHRSAQHVREQSLKHKSFPYVARDSWVSRICGEGPGKKVVLDARTGELLQIN